MKEQPILFSAPMVRAILDGRKTQTRRIVKGDITTIGSMDYLNGQPLEGCSATLGQCPFGVPGDRLWVRETWRQGNTRVLYRTDDVCPSQVRWRPSIHMPRWASRITLEITDVRVQRLQEISDEDALAEGLRSDGSLGAQCSVELTGHRTHHDSPKECFRLLWESIHGPGSWDVNHFVWVIVFRRIGL